MSAVQRLVVAFEVAKGIAAQKIHGKIAVAAAIDFVQRGQGLGVHSQLDVTLGSRQQFFTPDPGPIIHRRGSPRFPDTDFVGTEIDFDIFCDIMRPRQLIDTDELGILKDESTGDNRENGVFVVTPVHL